MAQKWRYNGVELDEITDLYEMDFRQYDPTIARFTSIDPLTMERTDLTPYRYAYNNPVFWGDPSGLFESRREARRFRRNNNLKGKIVENADGSFSLHTDILKNIDGDWKSSISFTKISNSEYAEFYGQNIGEVGMAITAFTDSHVGKLNRTLSEKNLITRAYIELSGVRSNAQLADLQVVDSEAAKKQLLNSSLSPESLGDQLSGIDGATGGSRSTGAGTARRNNQRNTRTSNGSNTNSGQATPTMAKHTPFIVNGKPKTVIVSGKTKIVYVGPDGGKYYINDNGNRQGLDRKGNKRKQ